VATRCVFLGELAESKSSAGASVYSLSFKFESDQYMLVSIVVLGEIVIYRFSFRNKQ